MYFAKNSVSFCDGQLTDRRQFFEVSEIKKTILKIKIACGAITRMLR